MKRFWDKVDKKGPDECWEWTGALDSTGYGAFKLDGKKVNSHRVAWELTNEKIPDGLWVLHHCDNPRCANPSHLFLGTRSDNMRDAFKKGRLADRKQVRGSEVGTAKLTEANIIKIRARGADGETQAEIASGFPVDRSIIGRVLRRVIWKHV